MPKIDLTGQRFGKLVVIAETDKRASNGGIIWKCKCDCGNVVEVEGGNLRRRRNPTQSCGCKTNANDLTNQKFGSLTALRPTEQRVNGKVVWECQCDCGNIHYVHSANLKNGAVQSCGHCHSVPKEPKFQEKIINQVFNNWTIIEASDKKRDNYILYKCQCKCGNIAYKTISELRASKSDWCEKCHREDLTNQLFGRLKVIEYVGQTPKRRSLWRCQCICGNEVIVEASNLKSGNTKSCGCLTISAGEEKIMQILTNNNIKFETQKTFDTCRFESTNQLARFDFYLPKHNILIEYDGIQHYKQRNGWENLEDIQARDAFKTQWCQENNIKLIRIPYTEYNNINLQALIQ